MGSNEQKKTSIALLFRLLSIGFFFTFYFSLGLLIQSKTPTSPALPDKKRRRREGRDRRKENSQRGEKNGGESQRKEKRKVKSEEGEREKRERKKKLLQKRGPGLLRFFYDFTFATHHHARGSVSCRCQRQNQKRRTPIAEVFFFLPEIFVLKRRRKKKQGS